MTSTTKNEYVPGVCNIGKAEVKQRRMLGWIGLVICVTLWAAFAGFNIPAAWRLLVFIPATLSAIGFLQAAWHFCAKFGLGGVFNFGANVGHTDTVEQAAYRRKDRQTALIIIGLSAFIGMVVATAVYFVPV
jgi:hypothetical protein